VKKELGNLLELQDIDLRIRKLDEEIAQGYGDLDGRQAVIDARRAEALDLGERLEVVEKEKRDVEAELEDEIVRLKDRQTKLMNVQTNREYQSLLKEIEGTKADNKRREEEILRYAEIGEAMVAKIQELNNTSDAEEVLLAEEKARVAALAQELEDKKAEIDKVRSEKAGKVTGTIYKRYEQLRERRNGMAIVGVTNGVCQGCFMNIPAQQFNDVLRGDQLLSCPTCQRMMYHKPAEEA
jgi:predicted  nucleic acid-binding Zn-ribbon protein